MSGGQFPTPESLTGSRLEEATVVARVWGPGEVADARVRQFALDRGGWWRRRMVVQGVVFRRCVVGELALYGGHVPRLRL